MPCLLAVLPPDVTAGGVCFLTWSATPVSAANACRDRRCLETTRAVRENGRIARRQFEACPWTIGTTRPAVTRPNWRGSP
jgi:hypothetical protein